MKENAVGWFEIPVSNMDRAIKFYETVFNVKLNAQPMGSIVMAWFEHHKDSYGAGGALVYHEEFYKPSMNGALVYFNCEDLSNELSRIEKEGGKIIQEKTLIAEEVGYMAIFIDTEGNRVALHSRK